MQLGRKPKSADLFEAMKTEVEEPLLKSSRSPAGGAIAPVKTEGVHVSIEERVSLAANRDGGLEQMEVRGVLTLRIGDTSSARLRLALQAADDPAITFKVALYPRLYCETGLY